MVSLRRRISTNIDESAQLARAIAGDHNAFVDLIEAADDALRRVAASITNDPSGVDDVLQNAYIKAFSVYQDFQG